MQINYFDCEHCDCDVDSFVDDDNDDEIFTYGCTHPNGNGTCELDNKWYDFEADCVLLDIKDAS